MNHKLLLHVVIEKVMLNRASVATIFADKFG